MAEKEGEQVKGKRVVGRDGCGARVKRRKTVFSGAEEKGAGMQRIKDNPYLNPYLKAPWEISGQFDAETSVEVVSSDGAFMICELEPFLENWTPQEIAKAHLLKAAPQLRDALEAVLAYTETCLRNACTDHTDEGLKTYLLKDDPAAWQMIVKARAALKATEYRKGKAGADKDLLP